MGGEKVGCRICLSLSGGGGLYREGGACGGGHGGGEWGEGDGGWRGGERGGGGGFAEIGGGRGGAFGGVLLAVAYLAL